MITRIAENERTAERSYSSELTKHYPPRVVGLSWVESLASKIGSRYGHN